MLSVPAAQQQYERFHSLFHPTDIVSAFSTLLYYDYALVLPTEIKYLWKRKELFKVSTLVYALCRYALAANVIFLLNIAGKLGSQSIYCDTWYKVLGVISVLGRAAVIFTFLMRTYAVWNQNKVILIGLGSIGLACVVLDCMHVPGLRCHGSSSIQIVNTLLSILVCVFEATATILTFVRSIQALRFGGGAIALKRHTLDYLIVEQGVLYFGLVSVFTVGATVLNFKAAGGFTQRLLNAITLPLSGMLTARFILRLRAYSQDPQRLGGGSMRTNLSSFAATTAPAADGGGRGWHASLADEFGEDPLGLVFRAVESRTTDGGEHGDDDVEAGRALEGGEGEGEKQQRDRRAVRELLGQTRMGLERDAGGEEFWDEKRGLGTTTVFSAETGTYVGRSSVGDGSEGGGGHADTQEGLAGSSSGRD
ncbi:uncharacterized protein BXZ73DRAFT_100593 [Epithele typhae]|uniref:uncharacterized protein n=1 Tax=Epithele typhae TaxID=378194 RepID=UPI002008A1A1|nr:uncharacterized protein BXZ73DRAFT_100593 [Epithele typhae]KAH9935206.1 hypothetical protein BXZ73DRAFT_100593 [Epithele typhae]